jgi:hypothetical protein
MPVTVSNSVKSGVLVSFTNPSSGTYEIQYNIVRYSGMYLYVNYTKGSESSVDFFFKASDSLFAASVPPSGAYYVIKTNSSSVASQYFIRLTSTGKYVMPVPSPESADFLTAEIVFNGPDDGTINVFGNYDDSYA